MLAHSVGVRFLASLLAALACSAAASSDAQDAGLPRHVAPADDAWLAEGAPPSSEITARFDAILAVLRPRCAPSCGEVELRARPRLANAVAVPLVPGARSRIVYDPALLEGLSKRFGDSVASAVLAHELGHHLDVTMGRLVIERRGGGAWGAELAADAWAGCAMSLLGAPLAPLLSWMRDEHVGSILRDPGGKDASESTSSHPVWNLRMQAVRDGHAACGGASASPAEPRLFEASLGSGALPWIPRGAMRVDRDVSRGFMDGFRGVRWAAPPTRP